MTIACNSAYTWTETLNFTFAWQAIIVFWCRMPNINVPANYFLPIMSEYTLIASKWSIWLLTQAYTELLLILVKTCHIAMWTWTNAQNATPKLAKWPKLHKTSTHMSTTLLLPWRRIY